MIPGGAVDTLTCPRAKRSRCLNPMWLVPAPEEFERWASLEKFLCSVFAFEITKKFTCSCFLLKRSNSRAERVTVQNFKLWWKQVGFIENKGSKQSGQNLNTSSLCCSGQATLCEGLVRPWVLEVICSMQSWRFAWRERSSSCVYSEWSMIRSGSRKHACKLLNVDAAFFFFPLEF